MELSVNNVTVHFGALTAVAGVSFSVRRGEIVALIGPNGAGKTTLLNAISGFIDPAEGTVMLAGTDVTSHAPQRRTRFGIGRTFQHARLMDELSVVENVLTGGYTKLSRIALFAEWIRYPSVMRALTEQRSKALELLESMDLGDVADVQVSQLSFGRKKLVDLARSLIARPRLVLMDEPTAGLSEAEIGRLIAVVERMRKTTAIVLVAHHMGFVSKVANQVICLVAGRVIAQGVPREVQADRQVLAAYMGTT